MFTILVKPIDLREGRFVKLRVFEKRILRNCPKSRATASSEESEMILDKRVDGRTKLTGLIGNPVEHTVSLSFITAFFVSGYKRVYLR